MDWAWQKAVERGGVLVLSGFATLMNELISCAHRVTYVSCDQLIVARQLSDYAMVGPLTFG